ncbi:MAG TPA: thiamine-phosphate kinase [Candidatus Bathyarchaeia archaeon]|nr:thiamine-phosphate kinase [Candidatus Bathyarchaeia archaeon]
MGEHSFLNRLCARLRSRTEASRGMLIGPGDDCAILAPPACPIAATVDTMVEGVHFRPGWLSLEELGARAATISLSDLAAMGATPAYLLIAVSSPAEMPIADLDRVLDGFAARSAADGAQVAGGNLSRAPLLTLTVTALGWVEGPCLARKGALPGDHLVVTGNLGAAAAAVAEWLAGREPAPALRERFANPSARIAAGRTLAAAGAHAAIDVSDGLLQDLGHLCAASGVGAAVDRERLPRLPEVAALDASGADFAASGGEDYELVFACPPAIDHELERFSAALGLELTVIGRCTEAQAGVRLLAADGTVREPATRGFDHFRAPLGSGTEAARDAGGEAAVIPDRSGAPR